LYDLHEKAKNSSYLDSSTPEYRLAHMIMDIANHRLVGQQRIIDECELNKPRKFLHLKFDNKGIDAVNVNNILNHKKYSPVFRLTLRSNPHLVFHIHVLPLLPSSYLITNKRCSA
jgi:hypothetical protein